MVVRYDDNVSVLYGRCLHRAALMSDGHVEGNNLFCGVHNWDYRIDTGVSEYNNAEALHKSETRACGHNHLNKFDTSDLTTWKKEIAELAGVRYAGVGQS